MARHKNTKGPFALQRDETMSAAEGREKAATRRHLKVIYLALGNTHFDLGDPKRYKK